MNSFLIYSYIFQFISNEFDAMPMNNGDLIWFDDYLTDYWSKIKSNIDEI